MKTHRPILFVLLFSIAGVLLFIYSTWRDNQRFLKAQNLVNHTNEVLRKLDQVRTMVVETESGVRGYSITGNNIFLWHLPDVNKNILATVNQLSTLVHDNTSQHTRSLQLKKFIEEKILFQQQVIGVKKASPDSSQSLISSLAGKKLMDQVSTLLTEMSTVENKLLQDRISHNKLVGQQSLTTAIVGALVVILFIIIVLLRLNSDITRRHKAETALQQSETRYRQFVENAGVITFIADHTGHFTFISQQVKELSGYTAEELMGRHFTALIPRDWQPIVSNKYYDQFLHRVRESSLVFPIIHKNKQTRWVEQDAILLEKNNQIVGFQCVVKDVTAKTLVEQKLKKVEEESKESQNRIQAIIDNTPLVIYIKDLEGRYMLVNKKYKETFNVTEEAVIGKTVYDIDDTDKEAADKYTRADEQVIATRKPVELEDVITLPDGEHHLLTVKFPLFDKKNEIFGVSGFMQDITEMVKSRQALIEARQKAEAAEMLQEQFLANMSHEIRTPMNGILGMSSLLVQTPLNNQQREYLEIIKQSSNNLMVLINDILDLSKIKAGKISLEQMPFDITSIIKPLIATFELKAEEKNVGFSVSLYPDVPTHLTGDPYRLNQVLINLLSNAFKFTEKGFVTMHISLHKQEEDQAWVSVKVSDSGIGIKHEQLNYIFESFAQASVDTTRRYGGTGLGLAITKRLVEMQQGSIAVTSEPNAGTTFTVIIPYRISSEMEVEGLENPVTETNHNGQHFGGKHILIVEDNEVNQRVLQYTLERYGISVSIVGDGSEAVSWLRDHTADLVMMDLHMPVMDGLQATHCIRRDLALSVPVVILTAGALKNERQKALDAGANDYITKPLAQEELERCLEKFLLNQERQPATTRKPAETNGKADFDLSDLLQLQDPESIRIVYDLFAATLPQGLEDLKNHAIKKDWNAVYEQAHKLKGSLGIIQVKELQQKMLTIEGNAKHQKKLKEILPLINEAISEFHEVLPRIRIAVEKEIA